jgi:hypothetical protein
LKTAIKPKSYFKFEFTSLRQQVSTTEELCSMERECVKAGFSREPNEMLVFGKIGSEVLHEEEAVFCGSDCFRLARDPGLLQCDALITLAESPQLVRTRKPLCARLPGMPLIVILVILLLLFGGGGYYMGPGIGYYGGGGLSLILLIVILYLLLGKGRGRV